ncbi:MAG: alkaline phosphatase [Lentisphaerae bacterium]|nr:alkaline phosphatase [Lentisphaerota bacterium]
MKALPVYSCRWLPRAACLVVLTLALCAGAGWGATSATNIILLIGDGMGPEQVKAGRYFNGGALSFESFPYQGMITTWAADNAITDSAAAGTAIATGRKVNNAVISEARPGDAGELLTALEYHQARGRRTGLVTTTYVTHATPAVFAAHERHRTNTTEIADDYLNQVRPNVLLGGGSNGMTRALALAAGYAVVTNRGELQALDPAAAQYVSGQFGEGNMPYEKGGLGDLPHLSEMTQTALDILEQGTNGFFLMAEGGRIDHACHENNIGRCVLEVVEFSKTVQVVLDWATGRVDTLVIVTADHETGGLIVTSDEGTGTNPVVSWATDGHTAAAVPVYAWGVGAEPAASVADNTEVSDLMMPPVLTEPLGTQVTAQGGTNIISTWDVVVGDAYRLESTTNLLPASWTPLITTTAMTATAVLADTNAADAPLRVYRLVPVH